MKTFFLSSSQQSENVYVSIPFTSKSVQCCAVYIYFLISSFLSLAGKVASIESLQHNFTNEPAKEGKRVKISCKLNGEPAPKATWFKDGRSINRNKTKFEFVVTR